MGAAGRRGVLADLTYPRKREIVPEDVAPWCYYTKRPDSRRPNAMASPSSTPGRSPSAGQAMPFRSGPRTHCPAHLLAPGTLVGLLVARDVAPRPPPGLSPVPTHVLPVTVTRTPSSTARSPAVDSRPHGESPPVAATCAPAARNLSRARKDFSHPIAGTPGLAATCPPTPKTLCSPALDRTRPSGGGRGHRFDEGKCAPRRTDHQAGVQEDEARQVGIKRPATSSARVGLGQGGALPPWLLDPVAAGRDLVGARQRRVLRTRVADGSSPVVGADPTDGCGNTVVRGHEDAPRIWWSGGAGRVSRGRPAEARRGGRGAGGARRGRGQPRRAGRALGRCPSSGGCG